MKSTGAISKDPYLTMRRLEKEARLSLKSKVRAYGGYLGTTGDEGRSKLR